jgi:hypothetical protein
MRTRSLSFAILCCAALSSAATPARADEQTHRAAVLELCDVMHMERTMQESMKNMIEMQMQQVPQMQRPQLQKFFDKYLSWASLKEDFVKLYQDTFSEAEVRQLTAFYKTPTGQKAVLQMPALMQRGAQMGANRVREHMGELMELLQTVSEKERRPGSPPPAAPAGALR